MCTTNVISFRCKKRSLSHLSPDVFASWLLTQVVDFVGRLQQEVVSLTTASHEGLLAVSIDALEKDLKSRRIDPGGAGCKRSESESKIRHVSKCYSRFLVWKVLANIVTSLSLSLQKS